MMISRDDDISRAIRQRDVTSIVKLMLDNGDAPRVRAGFRTEYELWDYKKDCPALDKGSENAWAELSKDVLAFYNNKGGIIILGITDDYDYVGATTRLDSKLVNDRLRRYLSDSIWVEYHREFIGRDQRYLGIALVPPRGPIIERFKQDAPLVNEKRLFFKGDSAIRSGDTTRILKQQEADSLAKKVAIPILGRVYAVDEPNYRILQPEYAQFIYREQPCDHIMSSLHDPRVSVTSLIGIGGVGKTALATWAVLKLYENKNFPFIVSITAKDRELTTSGIQALNPALTSFETLLNSIFDVLGFSELKDQDIKKKYESAILLLKDSNSLLYVDNLETVDDARIINFLDNLPIGVRAIVTSRRSRVRVAVRPIEIEALNDKEAIDFIRSLATTSGCGYCADFSDAECIRIREACDGIPLAIRWALTKSQSPQEALFVAESITKSGKRGDEILEFCFRRVFEKMPSNEKAVLDVLSLFQRPLPYETIIVGASAPQQKVFDAIDALVEDALINRIFDPDTNDFNYYLLPITRAFIYAEVQKRGDLEKKIRKNLTNYFEALDVTDPDERLIIREIRQGRGPTDLALVDLANAALRRGDVNGAADLYEQALKRNPKSWRAARMYAELQRRYINNQGEALRLYEQAAAHAPRMGSDKAIIFREWGMLLRNSGLPDATDQAIEKFEIALRETPNDEVTLTALARLYSRKGFSNRVIDLLGPLRDHHDQKTQSYALPLLLEAYEKTGDMLNAAQIRPIVDKMRWGQK